MAASSPRDAPSLDGLASLLAVSEADLERASAELAEARDALAAVKAERGEVERRARELDERARVRLDQLDEQLATGDSGPLVARSSRWASRARAHRGEVDQRLAAVDDSTRRARERLSSAQREVSTLTARRDALAGELAAAALARRRRAERREEHEVDASGVHARARVAGDTDPSDTEPA